jgi:serine/threonine protein kinase
VPYLVTELAEHGTVQSKIDAAHGAGISPPQAIRWTRQACQATARTHDAKLLHTDIKPDNLFLDANDNVQLGDFGFATLMDGNGLGHTSGTVTTLAPEVAQAIIDGRAQATSIASDVYSLGATLYEMLTGQPSYSPAPGFGLDLRHRGLHQIRILVVANPEGPGPHNHEPRTLGASPNHPQRRRAALPP